jgi:hypothetical protein
MGKGEREKGHEAFHLAFELARSGRYRDVREVEAAFHARHPEAEMPDTRSPRGKFARRMIDGACFRARRKRGWDA